METMNNFLVLYNFILSSALQVKQSVSGMCGMDTRLQVWLFARQVLPGWLVCSRSVSVVSCLQAGSHTDQLQLIMIMVVLDL